MLVPDCIHDGELLSVRFTDTDFHPGYGFLVMDTALLWKYEGEFWQVVRAQQFIFERYGVQGDVVRYFNGKWAVYRLHLPLWALVLLRDAPPFVPEPRCPLCLMVLAGVDHSGCTPEHFAAQAEAFVDFPW